MKKQTIAGDIRRLRNRMTIHNGSVLIKMDYFELLKLFDSIETKAKRMQDSIKPVLECDRYSCDCGAEYAVKCSSAVNEAKRIWKEGVK